MEHAYGELAAAYWADVVVLHGLLGAHDNVAVAVAVIVIFAFMGPEFYGFSKALFCFDPARQEIKFCSLIDPPETEGTYF